MATQQRKVVKGKKKAPMKTSIAVSANIRQGFFRGVEFLALVETLSKLVDPCVVLLAAFHNCGGIGIIFKCPS